MESNSFDVSVKSGASHHTHKIWKVLAVVAVAIALVLFVGLLVNKKKLSEIKGELVSFQDTLSELNPDVSAAVISSMSKDKTVDSVARVGDMEAGPDDPVYNDCPENTSIPWLKVVLPNGGESYSSGATIDVKWNSCHVLWNTGIHLGLSQYTEAGVEIPGQFTVLSANTPNDGVQSVTLPVIPGINTQRFYRVVIRPAVVNSLITGDRSDANFKVIKALQQSSATRPKITSYTLTNNYNNSEFKWVPAGTDVVRITAVGAGGSGQAGGTGTQNGSGRGGIGGGGGGFASYEFLVSPGGTPGALITDGGPNNGGTKIFYNFDYGNSTVSTNHTVTNDTLLVRAERGFDGDAEGSLAGERGGASWYHNGNYAGMMGSGNMVSTRGGAGGAGGFTYPDDFGGAGGGGGAVKGVLNNNHDGQPGSLPNGSGLGHNGIINMNWVTSFVSSFTTPFTVDIGVSTGGNGGNGGRNRKIGVWDAKPGSKGVNGTGYGAGGGGGGGGGRHAAFGADIPGGLGGSGSRGVIKIDFIDYR